MLTLLSYLGFLGGMFGLAYIFSFLKNANILSLRDMPEQVQQNFPVSHSAIVQMPLAVNRGTYDFGYSAPDMEEQSGVPIEDYLSMQMQLQTAQNYAQLQTAQNYAQQNDRQGINIMENEEVIEWVDWTGKTRKTVIHRHVK